MLHGQSLESMRCLQKLLLLLLLLLLLFGSESSECQIPAGRAVASKAG